MYINVEQQGKVALLTLNRASCANALSSALLNELLEKMTHLTRNDEVACFVITGNEDVFCAGADIREMFAHSHHDMIQEDYFSDWDRFTAIKVPKIAAVSGYALGGGCELAMMCDFIYAAKNAVFAQPEINLGVIPAIGGTQRLPLAIGKAKAMELVLTGRFMNAEEAERSGLVARVFNGDELLEKSLACAQLIASKSTISIRQAKEAIDQSLELGLKNGLLFERRTFHSLFATEDQKEGMSAFLEKRSASFTDK